MVALRAASGPADAGARRRALAGRGAPAAAARHRQSSRIRLRGVVVRARASRHRLRASSRRESAARHDRASPALLDRTGARARARANPGGPAGRGVCRRDHRACDWRSAGHSPGALAGVCPHRGQSPHEHLGAACDHGFGAGLRACIWVVAAPSRADPAPSGQQGGGHCRTGRGVRLRHALGFRRAGPAHCLYADRCCRRVVAGQH